MNLVLLLVQLSFVHIALVLARIRTIEVGANLTEFKQHRRQRSLIFDGGGQIKLVIGPVVNVDFVDPVSWRSMVCLYNLQGGHYNLPAAPLYPWDKWEHTFARSMQQQAYTTNNDEHSRHAPTSDNSRLFVYTALESLMHRQRGVNGRDCLLRSICQNAQVDQHVGVFSEILNIVLTPGKEPTDEVYRTAYAAGQSGVDCLHLYATCPEGVNILDQYLDYL